MIKYTKMYPICTGLAPCSSSQPPMVTMSISTTLTSSRSSTVTRAALLEALSRFGCSMMTPSRSSIPRGPYNPWRPRATVDRSPRATPEPGGRGGTGRRARFRSSWPLAVGVRVPPPASQTAQHHVEADVAVLGAVERLGDGADDREAQRLPERDGGGVGLDHGVELDRPETACGR